MRTYLKFPEIRIGYWGVDSDSFFLIDAPLIHIFRGDYGIVPFSIIQSKPATLPVEYYSISDPEITIEIYPNTFYVANELIDTQYGTIESLADGHFKWILEADFTAAMTASSYGIWVKNAGRTLCKFLLELL